MSRRTRRSLAARATTAQMAAPRSVAPRWRAPIIDIVVLIKDADGGIEAIELSDFADLGPLQIIQQELADLLTEDDVIDLAAAMEPGSTAGLLVYENVWAAPFASAVRHSGGRLISDGRIRIQSIIASIENDEGF